MQDCLQIDKISKSDKYISIPHTISFYFYVGTEDFGIISSITTFMPGVFYNIKYMIKDVVFLRGVKKENYVFKLHILRVFFVCVF